MSRHPSKAGPDSGGLAELRCVGRSAPRVDAREKTTGAAAFLDDLPFAGLLHAAIHRSTRPHALIQDLHTQDARALPGVVDVLCAEQLPFRIGECLRDHAVLAGGKVRYVGEPVAVVVALDALAARRGAELVRPRYHDLPAVFDVDEAMAPGAPLVHPDLASYRVLPSYHPSPGTNVFHSYRASRGDPDAIFRRSDSSRAVFVHRGTYDLPHIAHAQLEPHGAVALWTGPRDLTTWCCAQSPHLVRKVLAEMFQIPMTRVRVVVPYIGGGFGGKSDTTVEPLAAAVARAMPGRPVKLLLSREEMFFGTLLGRGCRARLETAHDPRGRLLAARALLAFACGACGDYGINVVEGAGHVALGPYRVPHFKVESRAVYTNTPFIGAFRGYGHPEVHWAMERHLDHVAQRMGLDPTELRRINLLAPGDEHVTGQLVEPEHGDLSACLDAASSQLSQPGLPPPEPGWRRGSALCPMMKAPVMATNASSAASLRMNGDGTVDLSVGGTEMGQGSATALTQLASQALGMPLEKIRCTPGVDTAHSPYEWQSVGSTTTWKVGQAIRAAASQLLQALKTNAALRLSVPPDQVGWDGSTLWDLRDPSRRLEPAEVALNALFQDGSALGGPVAGWGTFTPSGLNHPDANGQGRLAAEWTFGCQGAVIDVDLATGRIRVLRLVTALDVGRVVNPRLARGQVVGAMVQGLGAATMERVIYDSQGRIRNAGLSDYKIPTPKDLADVDLRVVFLETPFPDGPFGARCLAEHGLVSVPPAIANALRQATGLHMDSLPITADSVLCAMLKHGPQPDRHTTNP